MIECAGMIPTPGPLVWSLSQALISPSLLTPRFLLLVAVSPLPCMSIHLFFGSFSCCVLYRTHHFLFRYKSITIPVGSALVFDDAPINLHIRYMSVYPPFLSILLLLPPPPLSPSSLPLLPPPPPSPSSLPLLLLPLLSLR